MDKLTERITSKCLNIYGCKRSLKAVKKFLDRVIPDDAGRLCLILEENVKPAIRNSYFKELTTESFLQDSLNKYRNSEHSHSSVLITIWERLDELPFTSDEYSEFAELLEDALSKEPNPPSPEDWEELNEWLMK